MAHPLPSEYKFGKVIGRAVHAIADTAADEDHLPEARPAVGKVTFKPRTSIRKALHDYSAFVIKGPVTAELDELGRIIDAEGRLGIWLVTGLYEVSWGVDGNISPFEIEVTDAHTDASPLDLVTAAPPQPGPGITVQTLLVPSGAALGQVLGWTPDGIGWIDPEVAGDVSPEVIEARDTAVSAASSAQGSATAAAQSAVDAENDRVAAQQAAADALAISVQPPEKGDPGEPGPQGDEGPPGPKGDTGAPGALADAASYIITGPGRPDVPATTGGIITGTEPVGAEYRSTDGAGVGAWVWMKRPAGWVVTDGDTGWRDLTDLASDPPSTITKLASSAIMVRRRHDGVEVLVRWAGSGIWSLLTLPAGFKPDTIPLPGTIQHDYAAWVGTPDWTGRADYAGYVAVSRANGIVFLAASKDPINGGGVVAAFKTITAWPSTLPGTAI